QRGHGTATGVLVPAFAVRVADVEGVADAQVDAVLVPVPERGGAVDRGFVRGRPGFDAETQPAVEVDRVGDHQPVGGVALVLTAETARLHLRCTVGGVGELLAVEVPAAFVEVLRAGPVDLRRLRTVDVDPFVAFQVVADVAAGDAAFHRVVDAHEAAPADGVDEHPVRPVAGLAALALGLEVAEGRVRTAQGSGVGWVAGPAQRRIPRGQLDLGV